MLAKVESRLKPSSVSFGKVIITNERLYENIGKNTKHMDAVGSLNSYKVKVDFACPRLFRRVSGTAKSYYYLRYVLPSAYPSEGFSRNLIFEYVSKTLSRKFKFR